MTVYDSYQYVQNALNKLSSNSSQNVTKTSFVNTFNAVQYQWVEDRIKLGELNKIRIDEIQQLLKEVKLTVKKKENYFLANLPSDYFHFVRSYSNLKGCSVMNWLVKEGDVGILLSDEFWKPSKEWGETICSLAGNQMKIYVDNFNISDVVLVYFRYPVKINMKDNFEDVNGVQTEDVNPEFQGSSLIEILNFTIQHLAGTIDDQLRYQVFTNKTQVHT